MHIADGPRRLGAWAGCLCPGLPRLWQRGDPWALLAAVALTAALNVMLLLTFIMPVALGPISIASGWLAVGISWIIGIWRTARRHETGASEALVQEGLFIQAQAEYLKGHWFEAQAVLERLLAADPRDIEAQLMLATLYRRTGRQREARRQLRILQRIDGAERWSLEIEQERRLAQRGAAAVTTQPEGTRSAGMDGPAERLCDAA